MPDECYEHYINDGISAKRRKVTVPSVKDIIVQHAVKNVLEDILCPGFYEHSYASIEGKGTHAAIKRIKKWIKRYTKHTKYCLKTDVRKYFESLNQDILLAKMRKKIRDNRFYDLLETIVRQIPSGLALGFVTSQPLANYYLTDLDYKIKELDGVEFSVRFLDDIVIFGPNKRKLHRVRKFMDEYLTNELDVQMKPNWQVFRVQTCKSNSDGRFVDFLGYKFYKQHVGIRRNVALKAQRKAKHIFKKDRPNIHDARQIVIYSGISKYADCRTWFKNHILPYVSIQKMRKKISTYDKRHKSNKRRRYKYVCGTQENQRYTPSLSTPRPPRSGYTSEKTLKKSPERTKKATPTPSGHSMKLRYLKTSIRYLKHRLTTKLGWLISRKSSLRL